jgi:AraC-like DNA-binding protein
MDVLSDVVTVMRTGRPVSTRISWRAPWGQAFPAKARSAGFHVVLRGSCWLLPPSGDPLPLSAGDVVLLPHGDGYGLADDPERPLNPPPCDPHQDPELFASACLGGEGAETVTLFGGYELDPGMSHPLLTQLPDVIHPPTTLGRHPELRAVVELLASEIDNPRPGTDVVVASLFDALHLFILRAWYGGQDETCARSGWAAALTDPAISRALNAVHNAPAQRWTVESLSACAGLSRAAFSRRFTNMVGRPPLAYLTWWRLTTAALMLRQSNASVAEVAQQVGYGSEFSFGNAFKRHHGTAPGKFRRQVCDGVSPEH